MIVVVDDYPTFLNMCKEVLIRDGYEVVPFGNAAEALDFLKDNAPKLIISDIVMPDMDGFEFKRTYGDRFPHRQTPFIFLTGQSCEPSEGGTCADGAPRIRRGCSGLRRSARP